MTFFKDSKKHHKKQENSHIIAKLQWKMVKHPTSKSKNSLKQSKTNQTMSSKKELKSNKQSSFQIKLKTLKEQRNKEQRNEDAKKQREPETRFGNLHFYERLK